MSLAKILSGEICLAPSRDTSRITFTSPRYLDSTATTRYVPTYLGSLVSSARIYVAPTCFCFACFACLPWPGHQLSLTTLGSDVQKQDPVPPLTTTQTRNRDSHHKARDCRQRHNDHLATTQVCLSSSHLSTPSPFPCVFFSLFLLPLYTLINGLRSFRCRGHLPKKPSLQKHVFLGHYR